MKKYLLCYIPVLVCFAQTAFAQLRPGDRPERKELQMPFPEKLVRPASTLIIQAHIPDIKRPFVVSRDNAINNVRDFINKVLALCPSRKSPAPTLILNAERINNQAANLQWETKYAFKASGFNIERSLADSFHFATVNFAWAATGTGFKKNYHQPDYNDYSGISYYRIRQLNTDTAYLYSNIAAIKGYDAVSFSIYPNPASGKVWIQVLPKQSGNAAINIYDATGKLVRQQSAAFTEKMTAVQSIDVSKLAAGVYQVKILMPDKTFLTGKLMKQ